MEQVIMTIVGLKGKTIMISCCFLLIFFSCLKDEKHWMKEDLNISWYKTQVDVPIDTSNHETRVYYILKIANSSNCDIVMHLKKANKSQYIFNIIYNDTISLWGQRNNDSIVIPKYDTIYYEIRRSINQLLRPNMSFNESLIKELEMTNKSRLLYLMKDSISINNCNSFFKYEIPKDSLYRFEIVYNSSSKNY